MTAMKAARQAWRDAKQGIVNKITTDDVWEKIKEAKRNGSQANEIALIEGLEHNGFINGGVLNTAQEEIVLAFLREHATAELQAYQDAEVAYKAAIEANSKPFAERVKRALGSAHEDVSHLGFYFSKLDDPQAMALGSAIESATHDIQSLMATRDAAQQAIDLRLERLGKDAVTQDLLPEDVAKRLTEDVSRQLEKRNAERSALREKGA